MTSIPGEPRPDQLVRYGPLPDQVADLWLPAASGQPLIVLIHGGFWRERYDRIHVRPISAALRAQGWPVAAVEYRRVTGDPDAATDDVRRALTVLPETVPGDGVLLAGHSAGGHLALWAASACPPEHLTGTVALAPVADLTAAYDAGLSKGAVQEFLGGHPRERPDLDPVRLGKPHGWVVLVHGTEDTDVPLAMSQSYVRSHPGARLMVLPGTGHFELINPLSNAWPRVLDAFGAAVAGRLPVRRQNRSPVSQPHRRSRSTLVATTGQHSRASAPVRTAAEVALVGVVGCGLQADAAAVGALSARQTGRVVMLEGPLRARIVSAPSLIGQLDRLLAVIGLPALELGIIPFEAVVPVFSLSGFRLYDDLVIVEPIVGEQQLAESAARSSPNSSRRPDCIRLRLART